MTKAAAIVALAVAIIAGIYLGNLFVQDKILDKPELTALDNATKSVECAYTVVNGHKVLITPEKCPDGEPRLNDEWDNLGERYVVSGLIFSTFLIVSLVLFSQKGRALKPGMP
jgi:hypothetical protein